MILDRLAARSAVAVVRLRSMGDTVLTTPALRLLKQARPDLRVYVAIESVWRPLLAGNPDIEGVISAEPGSRMEAVAALRRIAPELCLNLHGGTTSAWLTALSGARWRAGFAHFRHRAVYNVRIPRAQEILERETGAPVHTAEHLASAMFYLGAPKQEIPPAQIYSRGPGSDARRTPYAVVHTGAAYFTKQWPEERFAEVARWLQESEGLDVIAIRGPEDCTLEEMIGLIRGAKLFVGNDSGPAHVAAALGVPVVGIFGSSDSRVWHPWRTRYELVETRWECKPCPGDRCYAFDRPHCILSVEIREVKAAVQRVLHG